MVLPFNGRSLLWNKQVPSVLALHHAGSGSWGKTLQEVGLTLRMPDRLTLRMPDTH